MSSHELHIHTHRTNEHTVTVEVHGELDIASSQLFRQALQGAEAGESRHLLLDLRGVTFMDSTTLGQVVGAHNVMRGRGGEVRVDPSEAVRHLFAVTGLNRVIALAPDPAE